MKEHGADIYTASEKTGLDKKQIIDFSSNINPLGIPESVKTAVINSVNDSDKYPDICSRELIKSISEYENVDERSIFPSNGAAEAIFRIIYGLKPKKGLVTAPAFSEYENALRAFGASVVYYDLKKELDFKILENILCSIKEDVDIVFLCNPNNPTGQLTDKNVIKSIIEHCHKINTTVVIDECFLDFVINKKQYTAIDLTEKYDNLIILKAFTKLFAIPGIRLGYCIASNITTVEKLKVSGPPWNVSNIAQAAGAAALKEANYINKSINYVKAQRNYLVYELNKLNIKTYTSHANYILLNIREKVDLQSELLKKGILIRSCSNYNNLDEHFYRIAVKSDRENKLLIKSLKEIFDSLGIIWNQF